MAHTFITKKGELLKKYLTVETASILMATSVILLLTSLFFWPFLSFWGEEYKNFIPICISSFIALANAILLYSSLISQRKSFNQERFETTFFNLLDTHRKLTNGLSLEAYILSEDGMSVNKKIYRGKTCFKFACYEILNIRESIFFNKYEYPLDEEYLQQCYNHPIFHEDNPYSKEKTQQIENEIFLQNKNKLINRIYNIKKDTHQKANETNTNKEAYSTTLFLKYHYLEFEYYLKNLQQLLKYISEMCPENLHFGQYASYVSSQMPAHEIQFIHYYSAINEQFHELAQKSKINL